MAERSGRSKAAIFRAHEAFLDDPDLLGDVERRVDGGESAGVGNYCLMCYGGDDLNPVEVNAALKLEAGWATSLRVAAPDTTYRLSASGNDFLVHRRSVSEFFVLENRNQSGRDSAIPDSGLAIWHVEVNGSNSSEQMTAADHYYISLEQADGRFDLEHNANAGDGGDCYASPGPTAFSASTTPRCRR